MNKTRLTIAGVVLIAVIVAAAFFVYQQPKKTSAALPVRVVDDAGRIVTLTSYPNRIVSLAPSCTEILFALGLENRTFGSVSYDGYPQDIQNWLTASNVTVVGNFGQVNIEAITSLQPNLVLGTGGYQDPTTQALEGLGMNVMTLSPIGFAGVLNDIALVGNATGQISEQQALVANLTSQAAAIVNKVQGLNKTSVYVEYYFDSTGFGSYGGSSFVNDLISMAGGVNVFAGWQGQYVTTSSEVIVSANPQIIIISNGIMSSLAGLTPEVVMQRPGWNEISAVQNNRIYLINEDLITTGGPDVIYGLEDLAQIIHPEIFGAYNASG
ncbi:MAG: ABC transporter substrate-binding protein [Candidatus Bathyarchaeia archaeon]|jgi:iron complex transport system substrate-binding protein